MEAYYTVNPSLPQSVEMVGPRHMQPCSSSSRHCAAHATHPAPHPTACHPSHSRAGQVVRGARHKPLLLRQQVRQAQLRLSGHWPPRDFIGQQVLSLPLLHFQ